MPLIPCPECKKQISTAAVACPHCGSPLAPQAVAAAEEKKAADQQLGKNIGIGCLVVVVAGFVLLFVVAEVNRRTGGSQSGSTVSAPSSSEGYLMSPKAGLDVFVWRDGKALDEGTSMIQSGVHTSRPDLILALVSCSAPENSKVIITDRSMFQRTVIVVDGKAAGCRGVVPSDFVKTR